MFFLAVHFLLSGEFSPHKWAGFAGGFLLLMSLVFFVIGFLADMLSRIKNTQEEILFLTRKYVSDENRRIGPLSS